MIELYRFPSGGLFSQHMDLMKEGGQLSITAIAGDMEYQGHSQFLLRNPQTHLMERKKYKRVGMIASGSGITPMYQVKRFHD
jgi:ferredoxin-NADP reductase